MADLMLEKGAVLVPTRWIVQKLLDIAAADGAGLTDYQMDKVQNIATAHLEGMCIAARKGVPMALGTS
jgi:hypothetical protein